MRYLLPLLALFSVWLGISNPHKKGTMPSATGTTSAVHVMEGGEPIPGGKH
jgi:hypothetical protein